VKSAADLPLNTSDFDFDLPPGRIARFPVDQRDGSRLLVLHRDTGRIEHRIFRDIVDLMAPGDALVLNETRVLPARLLGRKSTGANVEVLLVRPIPEPADTPAADGIDTAAPDPDSAWWEALVRPGSKVRPGHVVEISDELSVEIVDRTPDGGRIVRLRSPLPVQQALARYGQLPLPPYMERDAEALDQERYQTVYAAEAGSVAAPTAGLHFTPALLQAAADKGIRVVRLILHVGVGTFRPVEVEDAATHVMHSEWYCVPAESAAALNRVRAEHGSIWAVGTTVARTLETVADEEGIIHDGSGWTSIFLRPPYRFRGVDRLVTNFHLPRSTLLMLVAAFGGYDRVMRAYGEAVEQEYRFYSYGDAMAII
jgi:S-adenosylmethionine:tRNA ribosyltransferase-isomerase